MPDSDTARELRPVGRYEWESVILRARLAGLIQGSSKRGGVTGLTFKAVALVLASHADGVTGAQVFPGDATVAVLAETSLKTVKAVKAALIQLGLIDLVRSGARRSRGGNEYRLTLPTDLLDMVEVLTPAGVKAAAVRESDKARRPQRGSAGPHTTPDVQGPADPKQNDVRVPADPEQPAPPETRTGSSGPAISGCTGSSGPAVQGPVDRYTNHDHPLATTQPMADVDLTVTHSRETAQDPIFPPLPTRCDHGLRARRRDDGSLSCALCRVVERLTAAAHPATA